MGDVRDVITCAKFQIEIVMGYDFTGGRIFDFPIDFFCMGLTTVLGYALPVILSRISYTLLEIGGLKQLKGTAHLVVKAGEEA